MVKLHADEREATDDLSQLEMANKLDADLKEMSEMLRLFDESIINGNEPSEALTEKFSSRFSRLTHRSDQCPTTLPGMQSYLLGQAYGLLTSCEKYQKKIFWAQEQLVGMAAEMGINEGTPDSNVDLAKIVVKSLASKVIDNIGMGSTASFDQKLQNIPKVMNAVNKEMEYANKAMEYVQRIIEKLASLELNENSQEKIEVL